MTATQLRRVFVKEFVGYGNHGRAPGRKAFARLVHRFDASGGVTGRGQTEEDRRTALTDENIRRVEEYFTNNEKNSIRTAAEDLDLCYSTIWTILRKSLHWKPYRPLKVNRLTDKNREDRLAFVRWFQQ